MTEPAVSAAPDERLDRAFQRMRRGRYSHLPVVDPEGRVVGLLSAGGITRLLALRDAEAAGAVAALVGGRPDRVTGRQLPRVESLLARSRVADAMERDPWVVPVAEPIGEAAAEMETRGVEFVPVVEDRRIAGVLSAIDLRRVIERTLPEAARLG